MERGIYEIVDTESLVPAEHLLRKIDAAVDWKKLYDMVEPLYCADNGRPSVDPVVLFKMVLIQHLSGMGYPSTWRHTLDENGNPVPKKDKEGKIIFNIDGSMRYQQEPDRQGIIDWIEEQKRWIQVEIKNVTTGNGNTRALTPAVI